MTQEKRKTTQEREREKISCKFKSNNNKIDTNLLNDESLKLILRWKRLDGADSEILSAFNVRLQPFDTLYWILPSSPPHSQWEPCIFSSSAFLNIKR